MADVIRLEEWRRGHTATAPGDARLEEAVDRLDAVLDDRGWRSESAPQWVVTELLAIQGCVSMEMTDAAVYRIERLIQRSERARARH
jgi:hypothetical protein